MATPLARTRAARVLGSRLAIALGPFGNAASSVALTAAVSAAGGLGGYGCNHLDGGGIAEVAARLRSAAAEAAAATPAPPAHPLPFNLNLWVPLPGEAGAARAALATPERFAAALAPLAPARAALGVPPPPAPPPGGAYAPAPFEEQAAAVLAARPAVFSFVFGVPPADVLSAARAAGIVTMGTATSAHEASALDAAGVDVVVASGWEAGGHRPAWLADPLATPGLLALLPQVVDALGGKRRRAAVLGAGGVVDGRGAAACLALGADGVVMGTAFLACEESAAPEAHKRALSTAGPPTVVTAALSGRPARGVRTGLVDLLEPPPGAPPPPPYPVQNWLTMPLRRAAAQQGQERLMGMWAGQGKGPLCRRMPAARLIDAVDAEAAQALDAAQRGRG